jgi:predicted DNA-binding transcriptional regulator AlpA
MSNLESEFHAKLAAHARNARSRKSNFEIVPDDPFVGYGYIESSGGRGYGRTSVWRKEQEGTFPKGTIVGSQRKWRKSVIDAHFDALIPPPETQE